MATLAPPRPSTPAPRPAPEGRPVRRWLRPPGLDTLFSGVFALFGWGVGIDRLSDNSFFWHLRTGELILDRGIPHSDPFSFSAPGTHWVAQSWLAELLYGALDRTVGTFGIRVFCGLVGASIAVLAFRLALRLCHDRVRAALLTIAALAGLYTLWSERPLLIGVLFLLLVLWTVEVPDSVLGRRPLVALPIVFWLWANVHGTFALGFVFVGLHLLGRWLDGHRPWEGRERTLLTGAAIAFAASFVNPYGAGLVTFPVDLLGRGDVLRHVIEWASPDFHHVRGYAFALWIVVFAVIVTRGPKRVSRRDLVVALPFLLLGFWALRNVALAPLVGLPIAARAVSVATPRRDDARPRLGWWIAAGLALVVAAIAVRAVGEPDFALDSYPVAAMQSVQHQGLLGRRLLADDADGGYIVLRYWPQQRVFVDDRYDMYPLPLVHDYFTVNDARAGWDRVLRKYDIEVVVWARGQALSELLKQSPEWRLTHQDATRDVFVRRDIH